MIPGENILMEIILRLKVTMSQVKTKNFLGGIFADLLPCFNSYMTKYVYLRFSNFIWLMQLLSQFLWVLEDGSNLNIFCTKFLVKQRENLASISSSLLLWSKVVQWSYQHFLGDFKPKSTFSELIKVRLFGERLLMEITLKFKVAKNQVKTKKNYFAYFCRFFNRALTFRPRNTYINVFRILFGSSSF